MIDSANPFAVAETLAVQMRLPVIPLWGTRAGGRPGSGVRVCRCTEGLPVICKANSPGLHPLHASWAGMATADPEVIGALATRHASANVAVVTGGMSGLITLKTTGAEGEESLNEWAAGLGDLPETVVVEGDGTRWRWFLVKGSGWPSRPLADGLDIVGDRKFAPLPGSQMLSGDRLRWAPSPKVMRVAPLPEGWYPPIAT